MNAPISPKAPGEYEATLWTGGWTGRLATPVFVIGSTPKKFRIRAVQRTKLAGRNRWIDAGETVLVPKHAVTFKEQGSATALAQAQS